MKKNSLLLSLVAVVALAGCTIVPSFTKTSNEAGVCTKEAKICPDGSAVGREGPKCEFTPCPETGQADTAVAIKQLFIQKYNKQPNEVTVTISQEDATHARGGVKFGVGGVGEGGIFLAAKVNGVWQLVFDGNGGIYCDLVKPYNFPAEMTGDCYNNETINPSAFKTFVDKNDIFSFDYSSKYTIYDDSLWTAEGYANKDNKGCDTCSIASAYIISEKTTKTLDQYVIDKFVWPGKNLAEAKKIINSNLSSYQIIRINGNEFTKAWSSDMHQDTVYLIKHNGYIVGLEVYDENDEFFINKTEVQQILSTFKFIK